ncbi:hypothetical protein NKDENANG_00097 [Candidatus Entotheonellaceae bacterium PAL068K]
MRFLGFLFFMNNTQTTFFTQLDDALHQVGIADTAAEPPIEDVNGRLAQRIVVNVFNGTM